MIRKYAVTAAAAVAAIGIGYGGSALLSSPHTPSEAKGCNDWPGTFTDGECFAAGTIQYALLDMQGAIQFCKWRGANPGEWSRLKSYAATGAAPSNIITWLGGSIRHELEAYFAAGAPPYEIPANTAGNVCGAGKLLAPPSIKSVTPGSNTVTVEIGP